MVFLFLDMFVVIRKEEFPLVVLKLLMLKTVSGNQYQNNAIIFKKKSDTNHCLYK